MTFKVEHVTKNKAYIITGDTEQDAWENFLDHKLPLTDEAEDYTIKQVDRFVADTTFDAPLNELVF